MTLERNEPDYVFLASKLVAAYVGNNPLDAAALPTLITRIGASLRALDEEQTPAPAVQIQPAVPIKKSLTPDRIICLECGVAFKSLKRHLATAHRLTRDEYRTKWTLPKDYPMVAPEYGVRRSAIAKSSGLGKSR